MTSHEVDSVKISSLSAFPFPFTSLPEMFEVRIFRLLDALSPDCYKQQTDCRRQLGTGSLEWVTYSHIFVTFPFIKNTMQCVSVEREVLTDR